MKEKVDGAWLYGQIRRLAEITEPCAAGVQRQSYSEAYRRGVDHVSGLMRSLGMDVREDRAGNLFGTLPGSYSEEAKTDRPGAARQTTPPPVILAGSHLDTVRCAGAFDGAAGVICALGAAGMIIDSGNPLRHPFTVVGTIGEEGTRFGKVLLGSQCMTGLFTEGMQDDLFGIEDGRSMREAMREYGLPGDLRKAAFDHPVLAFFELHGEQGPMLEKEGTDIGIVETVTGIERYFIRILGFSSHCGTVPMNMRRDAAIAAARLMTDVRDYVRLSYTGRATATFGQVSVLPGSSNVIPGECVISADLRAGDPAILADLCRYLEETAARVCKEEGCRPLIRSAGSTPAVHMDARLQSVLETSCLEAGCSFRRMDSGAGHDAMIFAGKWPTAMLFLPNVNGISHHPDEEILPEFLEKGTDVLYRAIRAADAAPLH